MSFVDFTFDEDESLTTWGVVKPPKKLKVPEDVVEAEKTKVEVRKDLTSSLKFSSQVAPSNDYNVTFPTDAPILV